MRGPDEPGKVEDARTLTGAPDPFGRLWTPHRMAYIGGQNKPTGQDTHECPFCRSPQQDDETALIVHRGASAYVVLNLYPYNPGHLLVCPYRHVADLTDLTDAERHEISDLSATAMRVLRRVSSPAGFNLGMNQGETGGAGIAAHLHQHVVPRWTGDANFLAIIAQTKALPQVLGDTRDAVAAAWREEASC